MFLLHLLIGNLYRRARNAAVRICASGVRR